MYLQAGWHALGKLGASLSELVARRPIFARPLSSPMALPEYDAIVVGMGPSGSIAAATLTKAGKRVLALEAQDRVGGRVRTVPFGDGVVELGAEWIHGTENSRVYDYAIRNNVSLLPQDLSFKVYRSDGSVVDTEIVNDLMTFALAVVDDPPEDPEPLGQYITMRVHEYIGSKYPSLQNDTDFVDNFLQFMEQVINNYESSNSWNDVSTMSRYEELGGNQHMSWHKHGYKTLFEIILNKYKGGPGLPTLTVKLNTEVVQIKWPKDSTGPVQVTTKDGTVYKAEAVIVTVSLGVLKERHATLFSPPLPKEKIKVIEAISIGVVDKTVLRFEEAWWPKSPDFFGFLWKNEDRSLVPAVDEWTTQIFGSSSPMGHGKVLTVWTSGDGAKLVETLPEDVVKSKVMGVIRKFMGATVVVPEPIEMIRSTWYSNPFTRGSYSYDNTLTPQHPNARKDLGKPLTDAAGKPRVLFAGEATNPTHFSTVHGALDTGHREASRLLSTPSKI